MLFIFLINLSSLFQIILEGGGTIWRIKSSYGCLSTLNVTILGKRVTRCARSNLLKRNWKNSFTFEKCNKIQNNLFILIDYDIQSIYIYMEYDFKKWFYSNFYKIGSTKFRVKKYWRWTDRCNQFSNRFTFDRCTPHFCICHLYVV